MNDEAKSALLYCLLTTLVGVGMLVWSTTIEEQFQPFVFAAGLSALLVGGVLGVAILLKALWEG